MANTIHRYRFDWNPDFEMIQNATSLYVSCEGYFDDVALYFTQDNPNDWLDIDFNTFLVAAFGLSSPNYAVSPVSITSTSVTFDVEFLNLLENTSVPIFTFDTLPFRDGHGYTVTEIQGGSNDAQESFKIRLNDASTGYFQIFSDSIGSPVAISVAQDDYANSWLDPNAVQSSFDFSIGFGVVTVTQPGDIREVIVTHAAAGPIIDWMVYANYTNGTPDVPLQDEGASAVYEQQSLYFDPPLSETLDTGGLWTLQGQNQSWNATTTQLDSAFPGNVTTSGSGIESDPWIFTWNEAGPQTAINVSSGTLYHFQFDLFSSTVIQAGGAPQTSKGMFWKLAS